MLNENDIVEKLTEHLKNNGFEIIQSLDTKSKGVDIIADNGKYRYFIEAKGATSSKEHTARYGKAFDSKQIFNHIAKAIFASMKIISSKPAGSKTKAAIALPVTTGHKQELETVRFSIKQLGLKVFWVEQDKVTEE